MAAARRVRNTTKKTTPTVKGRKTSTTKRSEYKRSATPRRITRAPKTESLNNTFETPSADQAQKPSYRRFFTLLTILIVLGTLYLLRGSFVVAMVNNSPISRLAVVRELEKQGGQQTVDSLISKTLILQEARKNNITVSKDELEGEINKIDESLKAQGSDLDSALALQGQTREDLHENIQIRKMIEKLLSDKVNVSEDEVKTFYEENKAQYEDVSIEEVKETLTEQLKEQKLINEIDTWLAELRANAKINYFKNY